MREILDGETIGLKSKTRQKFRSVSLALFGQSAR